MSRTRLLTGLLYALVLAVSLTASATRSVAKPRLQKARIEIGPKGFQPTSIRLRRGVPARVTFVRTTDATCAKEIVLPDLSIRRPLPLNEAVVVSFTPTKSGPLTFVCGMNMLRGQLIVQ